MALQSVSQALKNAAFTRSFSRSMTHDFEWAVVGAGPAGILAVGKLIDVGVAPRNIAWIDPDFRAGDMGRLWQCVSSNTKVDLFTKFLRGCSAFEYKSDFELDTLDPSDTCELRYIAEPLLSVTETLKKKVTPFTALVAETRREKDGQWVLTADSDIVRAKKVILALGAVPKRLNYAIEEIMLEVALHPKTLETAGIEDETIAVFGSSHSAIVVLTHLLNTGVKKVINFYQSDLKYAVYKDDWILYDNTGLKGKAAVWAREHIETNLAPRLERVRCTDADFQEKLDQCSKVIYSVGFESRKLPGLDCVHDPKTGEMRNSAGESLDGMFGFGIAFPELVTDREGNVEHSVGLWKFKRYLDDVMPIWLKDGK